MGHLVTLNKMLKHFSVLTSQGTENLKFYRSPVSLIKNFKKDLGERFFLNIDFYSLQICKNEKEKFCQKRQRYIQLQDATKRIGSTCV